MPTSELVEIEEFDEDIVSELRNRARDVLLTQAIQHRSGIVCAGVVNEKQVSGRTRTNPFKEGLRVETRLFVVTGNDERERRVAHGT